MQLRKENAQEWKLSDALYNSQSCVFHEGTYALALMSPAQLQLNTAKWAYER